MSLYMFSNISMPLPSIYTGAAVSGNVDPVKPFTTPVGLL